MGLHTNPLEKHTGMRSVVVAIIAFSALVSLIATPAGAQAIDPISIDRITDDLSGEDIRFEDRDRLPAAMIEFEGTANSANARWLVHLYDQVFARPADLDGLDHWLARIAAGGERSREVVARSFLSSTEGASNEAIQAYQDLLGREPDSAGLAFWTDFLRTGSVNTLRFQHLASDEYFELVGGTDETYVQELYRELLGRDIDNSGFAFYVDQLRDGTPRWWVSRSIYESPESLGNRVTTYHQDILGRDPTSAELAQGVALILAEDERAVQATLLASDEAFEPFLLAAIGS